MYYNDPYTELYHYGVPGMKWGVRKGIYGRSFGGWRPFRMNSSRSRYTSLNPSDEIKYLRSHIRRNAQEMYRQGRSTVRNTYDKAISAAENAGFKAAGLEHYKSAILIGGGIALAGAATAGGIALYKHHKKKQAEKNKNKN